MANALHYLSESPYHFAVRFEEVNLARRMKNPRRSARGKDEIWPMIAVMYGLQRTKKGWTLNQLVNACDLDPRDMFRVCQEAMASFAMLRRHFPNADWPTAADFPTDIIERDPKGHYDEVIVFKPYRYKGKSNEVYAEWGSREPTFIADGVERIVRSRKPLPVRDAFKNALACARRTPGISAIWIDDPQGLFPPEARGKPTEITGSSRKSIRQPHRR